MIKSQNVIDTLKYVHKFSGQTILIKLGGRALHDSENARRICQDLALIRSVGVSIVLVHGGGASINEELALRNIESKFIDGLRVTTPETMDVVEKVLCGTINKRVVRNLNSSFAQNVKAVGISGVDGGTFQCVPEKDELGQVGRIKSVDTSLIKTLLATQSQCGANLIPVVAPIGMSEDGRAFNINADWAASKLAFSLGIKKIIYLTDQVGILGAAGELLSEVDITDMEALITGKVVVGGMLAKTKTILFALKNGVDAVHVIDASKSHALIQELFTSAGVGTLCTNKIKGSQENSKYFEELGAPLC